MYGPCNSTARGRTIARFLSIPGFAKNILTSVVCRQSSSCWSESSAGRATKRHKPSAPRCSTTARLALFLRDPCSWTWPLALVIASRPAYAFFRPLKLPKSWSVLPVLRRRTLHLWNIRAHNSLSQSVYSGTSQRNHQFTLAVMPFPTPLTLCHQPLGVNSVSPSPRVVSKPCARRSSP